MAKRIAYTFRREDYEATTSLVADEPWPDTFEEWTEQHSETVGKLRARGDTVQEVIVNPQEFASYCLRSGLDHNAATLAAFAAVVARKQEEGRA